MTQSVPTMDVSVHPFESSDREARLVPVQMGSTEREIINTLRRSIWELRLVRIVVGELRALRHSCAQDESLRGEIISMMRNSESQQAFKAALETYREPWDPNTLVQSEKY